MLLGVKAPDLSMSDPIARLNSALEGRYRVDRELGEGGTATVYLASDLRHERWVALKVLRPEVAAAVGSGRFLSEIRTTARLQHPHILPLFDSGEAAGYLFYAMPYVEGETLRDRIDREGPLPVDQAVRIATVVASALEHAHDRGIVHRDVKPANILLQDGAPIVADFGIALALGEAGGTRLTETGFSVGTPHYMSPEQATGDPEIGAAADIYALGCVLFEMLAGEPPFTGHTPRAILARQMMESAPDLRSLRDTVPAGVAGAVRRALSKLPVDRHATASDFAGALAADGASGEPPSRRRVVRRPMGWAAAVVSVASIGGLAVALSGSHPVPFAERGWILMMDFQNRTGDTLFDGLLDRAFAVALQQSRYVNVFPRSRVAETLAYMERDPSTILDQELAREVALREGIDAVVSPVIDDLGALLTITTTVLDPESGVVLVSHSAEAEGRDDVLRALDDLAEDLRKDLGEPFLSRLRNGVRLDRATTSSLAALRAWTKGNEQWEAQRTDAAAELYRRAVELDPGFAMAHVDLGQYYYVQHNDRERGDRHFEAALGLIDRVTQRERYLIEAKIAGWRGDRTRAVELYDIHLADYPDDQISWSNLGYELLHLGRWDASADAYRRAIELDPLDDIALVNLATVHSAAGRYEESVRAYQQALEADSAWFLNANIIHEYGFTLVDLGRFDEAEAAFRRLLAGDRVLQSRGHRSLALLRMRRGRYAEAVDHLRRSVLLDETENAPTTAVRNRAFLAAALLTSQGLDTARGALAPTLAIIDSAYVEPFFVAAVGALFVRIGDIGTARRLVDTAAARATAANDADQAAVHYLRGHMALAAGRADSALVHFQRATVLSPQPDMVYLGSLAHAQIVLGRATEARATLEELIEGRAGGREGQEPWILAHYRLARLDEDAGDVAGAVAWYERFLGLWDQADEGLAPVVEARQRLSALGAAG